MPRAKPLRECSSDHESSPSRSDASDASRRDTSSRTSMPSDDECSPASEISDGDQGEDESDEAGPDELDDRPSERQTTKDEVPNVVSHSLPAADERKEMARMSCACKSLPMMTESDPAPGTIREALGLHIFEYYHVGGRRRQAHSRRACYACDHIYDDSDLVAISHAKTCEALKRPEWRFLRDWCERHITDFDGRPNKRAAGDNENGSEGPSSMPEQPQSKKSKRKEQPAPWGPYKLTERATRDIKTKILRFFVAGGMPFEAYRTPEFQELLQCMLGPGAKLPAYDDIFAVLLDSEKRRIDQEVHDALQSKIHLNLIAEKWTDSMTRCCAISVLTSEDKVLPLDCAVSRVSGPAPFCHSLQDEIQKIGPARFSSISIEAAAKMRLDRKDVQRKWSWIVSLPDIWHRLDLLIKSICLHDDINWHKNSTDKFATQRADVVDLQSDFLFKALEAVGTICTFFAKSSIARAALERARKRLNITEPTVYWGVANRFTTQVIALSSVCKNALAIKQVAQESQNQILLSYFKKDRRFMTLMESSVPTAERRFRPLATALCNLKNRTNGLDDIFRTFIGLAMQFKDSGFALAVGPAEAVEATRVLNLAWRYFDQDATYARRMPTGKLQMSGGLFEAAYFLNHANLPYIRTSDAATVERITTTIKAIALSEIERHWLDPSLNKDLSVPAGGVEPILDQIEEMIRDYRLQRKPFKITDPTLDKIQFWRASAPGTLLGWTAVKILSIRLPSRTERRASLDSAHGDNPQEAFMMAKMRQHWKRDDRQTSEEEPEYDESFEDPPNTPLEVDISTYLFASANGDSVRGKKLVQVNVDEMDVSAAMDLIRGGVRTQALELSHDPVDEDAAPKADKPTAQTEELREGKISIFEQSVDFTHPDLRSQFYPDEVMTQDYSGDADTVSLREIKEYMDANPKVDLTQASKLSR